MLTTKKNKTNKLNNRGSALVIVIVVISFICILATLLLYLSVMNFQMKSTDYKTRVSFYGAEVPLEELRIQLAVDLSEAAEEAYKQVMIQYGNLNSADLRKAEYQKCIFEQIKKVWEPRNYNPTNGTTDWTLGINAVLGNNSQYHVIDGNSTTVKCSNAGCTCPYHIILLDLTELGESQRLEEDSSKGRMILHGIKVTYTADNGFSSIITTDLYMDVPDLGWEVNARVYDSLGNAFNYKTEWNVDSTIDREEIHYEDCVNYLNWTKQ